MRVCLSHSLWLPLEPHSAAVLQQCYPRHPLKELLEARGGGVEKSSLKYVNVVTIKAGKMWLSVLYYVLVRKTWVTFLSDLGGGSNCF